VRSGAQHLGARAGSLYAVNTCGAALGALLVPVALLPTLGASLGLVAVVAGSVTVGATAILVDHALRLRPPSEPTTMPRRTGKQEATQPVPQRQIAAWALLSGALTIALESLWSRTLALVHESSLHSFAVVLCVFLLGLSVGAGVGAWLMARGWMPRRVLGLSWMAAGIAVMTSPRLFLMLTDGMRDVAGASWASHEARIALLALAVMLPATICAGIVMPVLMDLAGASSTLETGPVLGRLLAANLVGSMLGPVLVSFLVVPRVGLWFSLTLVGGAMAVAGEATLAMRERRGTDIARLLVLGALGILVLLLSPGSLPRVRLEPDESLVSLREGALGTVAVVARGDDRRICIDNFYTVGGTLSAGDERLQGHLPLLLHPAPRRVAFLGLGTGITAGAALMHPVERVDVAELLPQVVDAAREDFAEANLGVTDDPRVHVVVDDARTFLRGSGAEFDVIVGDLFVPWRRGEAATYALEQFEAARAALAPGGIFCQWVPLYQLDEDDFRVVVRTFVHAFPNATLWRGDFHADEPALALVGFQATAPIVPAEVDARVRQLAAHPDPANPYLADPAGLWLYLVGALDPADPWLASAELNRDDAPWIELRSARRQQRDASGFTGEALTPLLERLRLQPLAGPLARLDPQHVEWRDAGADLWRASLLGASGREQDADALGMATLAKLPEPLQRAVNEALRDSQ
jgi:spermidine synthase